MNAHFERNGIYPLSTLPVENWGSDPSERTGKVVIGHINGKFIKATDDGHEFVEKAVDATQYNDHAEASLAAAKLIAKAQAKAAAVEGAPV